MVTSPAMPSALCGATPTSQRPLHHVATLRRTVAAARRLPGSTAPIFRTRDARSVAAASHINQMHPKSEVSVTYLEAAEDAADVSLSQAAATAAAALAPKPEAAGAPAAVLPAAIPAPAPPHPAPRAAPSVDLPLNLIAPRGVAHATAAAAVAGTAATAVAAAAAASPRRPFPPPLDLPRIRDALFGEPDIGPVFANLFALSRQRAVAMHQQQATTSSTSSAPTPGPLLYAPRFPRPPGSPPAASLPLLVYLPGIDGTGLAAYRQFPGLAARFQLRAVFLPPEDRTPFGQLVEQLAEQISEEARLLDPGCPVYLLGESFGGLLALALAQKLSCVDRLVLVNPATCFPATPWPALGPLLPALPPEAYRLLPLLLAPLLANPLAMAAHAAGPGDHPVQQALDTAYGLLDLLPELSSLRVVLPPATLRWRLQLLQQGAQQVEPALPRIPHRTLLIAGSGDLVLPSAAEGARLAARLPRARLVEVAGGSHALLQQAGVELGSMLEEEDFYVPRRHLTRSNVPPTTPSSSSPPPAPPLGGANFGRPLPLELPTPGEIRRAADAAGLTALRRLVSPVFLSTDGPTGRVQLGLDALPLPAAAVAAAAAYSNHGSSSRSHNGSTSFSSSQRTSSSSSSWSASSFPGGGGGGDGGGGGAVAPGPVLLVGNHQLLAAD
ncbi:hypothetical protein Agub_g4849, partial [Astrephomene gubernaculifera]